MPTSCSDCNLKGESFFSDCFDNSALQLEIGKENVNFKKGEFVIKEGEPFKGIFCVREGVVKIFRNILGKKEFILWFANPGEVIGIDSFVSKEGYSYSAKAMGAVEACFVSSDELKKIAKKNPELSLRMMEHLCKKIDFIEKRITSIAQKKTKAHLAEMLVALAVANRDDLSCKKGEVNYTTKDLASSIGTTQNYLYKILSELSKEKIIAIENRKLKIINLNKLSTIAMGSETTQ